MESIWSRFINEYKEKLPFKSLHIILEAFWHYCNDLKKRTNKLME